LLYFCTNPFLSTACGGSLEIPVIRHPHEPHHAKIGQPSLYGEERIIPKSISQAAESKLDEIAVYLKTKIGKRNG
jgi:hypothetical protein